MKTQNRITMATVLSLYLLISGFVTGQSYQFKPEWKEGETKTMITKKAFTKFEQGEIVDKVDQTLENLQVIQVIKSTQEFVEVVFITDFSEYNEIFDIVKKINNEIEFPEQIQIHFRINKDDAEIEIINMDEIFAVYNSFKSGIDKVSNTLEELKSENEPMFMMMKVLFGSTLDVYVNLFTSETEFEKLLIQKIEPLIIPFKYSYQPGEAIITEDVFNNPLVPASKIISEVSISFNILDEDDRKYEISITHNIDQQEFKDAYTDMIKLMMASFAPEDTLPDSFNPFQEIEISLHINQSILYDNKSSWVKSFITSYRMKVVDPQSGMPYETETIETVTVQ